MAEKENGKAAKWKFWGGIIVAALTAYSTIFVSLINASGAKEDSVKAIVSQLNDRIIPQLQEVINKQDEELSRIKDRNADLRERLAKLEGILSVKKETKSWLGVLNTSTSDDKKKPKILKKKNLHKVDLQQVLR